MKGRDMVWELNRLPAARREPVAWRRMKNRLSQWQVRKDKMDPHNIWF